MKKTDLYKNDRLKVVAQMKHAAGQRTTLGEAPAPDRKEQRKLDQARGLVPFAVKIDSTLAARLRDLATERQMSLNDLTDELLRKALDQVPVSGGISIWVDADACPAPVKDILFRAATRTGLRLTLVANRLLRVPASPLIRAVQVAHGFDAADRHIEAAVVAGDLVITSDIPLAAAVLARGAHALEPRGEWFSPGTIHERLQMRALMNDLRDSGVMSGGPSAFSVGDGRAFAAALDRFLAQAR